MKETQIKEMLLKKYPEGMSSYYYKHSKIIERQCKKRWQPVKKKLGLVMNFFTNVALFILFDIMVKEF